MDAIFCKSMREEAVMIELAAKRDVCWYRYVTKRKGLADNTASYTELVSASLTLKHFL